MQRNEREHYKRSTTSARKELKDTRRPQHVDDVADQYHSPQQPSPQPNPHE